MKIKGTVIYQDLGTGFWGIEGDNGEEWRPINLPENLKVSGKKVTLEVEEVEEGFSMFMWGKPIRIKK